MSRPLGSLVLSVGLSLATPALGQPDPWEGTWRGQLTTAQGVSTAVTLTLVADDGVSTGVVTGFAPNTEIRLSSVATDDVQVTLGGATDTEFGPLSFVYRLTRDDGALSGGGRVTLGEHGFDATLDLTRARRADVPQPQIEPRLGYFNGRWSFDYTGGEFPPISIGTRRGTLSFETTTHPSFVRGAVTGDVFGEPYEETWTIGFDPDTGSLVWHELLADGQTLTSLGNWTSPIAITFLTAPVEADGSVYILRRMIRTTSDTAFSVTDEFSVDGGPFRRLGNGSYIRAE